MPCTGAACASSIVFRAIGMTTAMSTPYWRSAVCPPIVLETKPASKLVNAWAAGVPAMLGPEPAYRELRSSPLDFLETPAAEAVLDAIDRLRGEPGLYAAMAENGLRRAASG